MIKNKCFTCVRNEFIVNLYFINFGEIHGGVYDPQKSFVPISCPQSGL